MSAVGGRNAYLTAWHLAKYSLYTMAGNYAHTCPQGEQHMTLPMPEFFRPEQVAEIYVERAALVAEAAAVYQRRHHLTPAAQDRYKIAAFGIDCQIGFCTPGASLFVPGAVEDMQRTLGWLYRNVDKITGLI